ncbi:MAG: Membrane protein insertase, YidC/Oxa1 family [Candidatus Moranbacteria bacterium GW2011_GWE2_35_2-]|nr:MAG: Membrane protein insertase, YidC/Oxa1 family [Candidatus Moranbacteria bacterium GW2011_GWE2_35_2-]KKQ22624.1 MAG: Membrane protein insertase, YidC/Oxa1 family [Candidatus Moranbacteria bacterium GW2011_GWF2_37_11]KKQ29027.1 MAG: Membrane protein insertase, YidC/Oxa1 family [Candidatus Moranbacteria bacterium GW2011_GWD1_37_17]KKQ30437.1 MAG: Membrane protein insertase, YidC/Oxa1 family [Candidatus Moranbacteria bacterium GW2011_GWE1_37_24]KKQ47917.1 MAG: Membrane protein insertase, Yid
MTSIFNIFVNDPIFNTLVFLYNAIPLQDFGIAIILTTIILKSVLLPISKKQIESQKKLQDLQPKIKELQEKHKDNKERQAKELMQFYKDNKVNPFGGCLPLIIQLIFLIAIYRIIIQISDAGFVVESQKLYSFITNPGNINHFFIGLIDLTKPNIPLAILAAAAQFWQTKMLMQSQPKVASQKDGSPDFAQIMTKQMLFLGPLMTLFIGIKFAAGLALYWLISTLFAIFQQLYIFKKK